MLIFSIERSRKVYANRDVAFKEIKISFLFNISPEKNFTKSKLFLMHLKF